MKVRSYQAIVTQYLGPTDTKGSRVKATAAAGSITIDYDDSLNSEEAHAKAAKALADKFKWPGQYVIGGMPDYSGYVFVSVEPNTIAFEAAGEKVA